VVAVTDADGERVASYNYEAFGTIKDATGALDNNITYTGRWIEPETGDYFYRARYYDSGIGRFISEDPIGFESEDYNFYRYVFNNATNLNDSSGTKVYSCAGKVRNYRHAWVCLNNSCAGLMPTKPGDAFLGGLGIIQSESYNPKQCKDISYQDEEKQCKFERCIKEEAIDKIGQRVAYHIMFQQCYSWRNKIINRCKREANS
jgi:RHS repeat-associated protein